VAELFVVNNSQKYAIGIFSKAPSITPPTTPTNCYWVNSDSIQIYYYSFSNHPLVLPDVYVNDPAVNATWIYSALAGLATDKLKQIANKIVDLRSTPFKNLEDLKKRLEAAFFDDPIKIAIKDLNFSRLKFSLFSIKQTDEVQLNPTH